MSPDNVQLVMAAYDAAERQDGRAALDLLDESAVWDMTGLGMPDLAKVYRGFDGILEFWSQWLAAWETIEFKTVEPEDHGDHVIVKVEQRNRGRASRVDVDFSYWQTFTVRGGKITASHMAQTRRDALEVVGLREEAMSQKNLEVVRAACRTWSDGALDAALGYIHPDALWEPSGRFIGSEQTYRGHAGVQEFWAVFREPWDRISVDPIEATELDERRVLTRTRFLGTGRASGAVTETEVFVVWTVECGRITRFQGFGDRAEALEAVGLRG